MAEVIWTPEAVENLEATFEYVSLFSSERAASLVRSIRGAMEPVGRHPHIGRPVPGFDREDLREVIHQNYRIVYSLRGEVVRVVAVWHSATDVPTRLRGLPE